MVLSHQQIDHPGNCGPGSFHQIRTNACGDLVADCVQVTTYGARRRKSVHPTERTRRFRVARAWLFVHCSLPRMPAAKRFMQPRTPIINLFVCPRFGRRGCKIRPINNHVRNLPDVLCKDFLMFIQRLPARAGARYPARRHGQASNKP
jgi:hypothetical protein